MNTSTGSIPPARLVKLCLGMEAILVFSLMAFPFVYAYWLCAPFLDAAGDRLVQEYVLSTRDILQSILDLLVIFPVLLQMLFFFRGVRRGQLFTLQRVRNARNIGLAFVIGYVLSMAVRTVTEPPFWEGVDYSMMALISMEVYSLQQLLLGTGLLVLSYILEKATVLSDEQELVI